MAEFDQDKAVRNAGTAPLPHKREKLVPLKDDYVPTSADDAIVQEAYARKQRALHTQVITRQARGSQKGYSKKELGNIIDARD